MKTQMHVNGTKSTKLSSPSRTKEGDMTIKKSREEFLELVVEYTAIGTDAFGDLLTDPQREAVACAARDMQHAEKVYGDPENPEYCGEADRAALAWLVDFNGEADNG